MGPGESELIYIRMSPKSTIGNRVSWDPFNPDRIASAANADLAQVMMDTQHLIRIQLNNEQKWATVVGIREEGKLVNMQTEHEFPAQNGECSKNVRSRSDSLDDQRHGYPIVSQPEGTECASQRRAICRCDFSRIAAGKTIFLHLGPPTEASSPEIRQITLKTQGLASS